jgi:hypothetical protein
MNRNQKKLKTNNFLVRILITSLDQQTFSKKRLLIHPKTKKHLIYFKIPQIIQIKISLTNHQKDLLYLKFHNQINQIFLLIQTFKQVLFSKIHQMYFRQILLHHQRPKIKFKNKNKNNFKHQNHQTLFKMS